MTTRPQLCEHIWDITQERFVEVALALFRYQAAHNQIYGQYIKYLKKDPNKIENICDIPFMPIGFFKQHRIVTGSLPTPTVFESSSTTSIVTSHHFVADTDWYDRISTRIFEHTYGALSEIQILALLPSYLERNNSSLVYMVGTFIEKNIASGFYLKNTAELIDKLSASNQPPTLLWGVTFALLDLAENHDLRFLKQHPNLIVMETGGMKGRRPELLREEVHEILTEKFSVKTIHSEYGMTELLSQAYSKGNGIFNESSTMKILLRDINDPFAVYECADESPRYGGINVIDLANIDSCAFIETQDLGRFAPETHTFEVIGRFDNSDVRGCNLMMG